MSGRVDKWKSEWKSECVVSIDEIESTMLILTLTESQLSNEDFLSLLMVFFLKISQHS